MGAAFSPAGSEGMWGPLEVLGGGRCHDENKRGMGIITAEGQARGARTRGKSGRTSSTDPSKKVFMFFLLIPFGERHITSIKATK